MSKARLYVVIAALLSNTVLKKAKQVDLAVLQKETKALVPGRCVNGAYIVPNPLPLWCLGVAPGVRWGMINPRLKSQSFRYLAVQWAVAKFLWRPESASSVKNTRTFTGRAK